MRRLWILMAAVLAFGAFAVVAPGAGAASNSKFCSDIQNLGSSSKDLSNAANLKSSAKQVASQFKTAAKHAPAKVKKAMNTIGSFIGSLGTKNPADLAKIYTGNGFQNYTKAIGVYVQAAATCSTS
jgi:hypothetical protein